MGRRLTVTIMLVALAGIPAGSALATPPEGAGTKLRCFSGSGGECTIDEDQTSGALDTTMGYAGLYLVDARSLAGRPLAEVDLSFAFECDGGGACIGGGSPRLSIPIDSTGDGATDGYAFVGAYWCGLSGDAGTVGTDQTGCQVWYGSSVYANWDAFAEANPTYVTGDALPFMIADQPFGGTISNLTATK